MYSKVDDTGNVECPVVLVASRVFGLPLLYSWLRRFRDHDFTYEPRVSAGITYGLGSRSESSVEFNFCDNLVINFGHDVHGLALFFSFYPNPWSFQESDW